MIDNVDGLKKSNMNFSNPTTIIIHGWMSSSNSANIQEIKNRYMLYGTAMNVIICNWAAIAKTIYPLTVMLIKRVGNYVNKLVMFLVSYGLDFQKIHLVGHSLGAHISGYAGAAAKPATYSRITGLDPAMPEFLLASPEHRLDPSDASFVDVIHTCAGVLGHPMLLGTVDFFPNGGTPPQPGCDGPIEMMSEYISRIIIFFLSNRFFLFQKDAVTADQLKYFMNLSAIQQHIWHTHVIIG